MAEWVTAPAILAAAGAGTGSPEQQAWAELCAAAVNAGLDARLEGAAYVAPPLPPELERAALTAGVQAYKAREASVDAQPNVDAIVGDYLEPIEGIIGRYATRGIS